MTLRARMFLLFGGVIVALLGAQWWLVTVLRSELRAESADVALAVGGSVLDAVGDPVARDGGPKESEPAPEVVPALRLRTPEESRDAIELELESVDGAATSADGLRASVRLADRPSDERSVFIPMIPLQPAQPTAKSIPLTPLRKVTRIPVPTDRIDELGREFQSNVLLGSLAILAVGLIASAFVAHRLTAPLRGLAAAADAVGDGAFGTQAAPVGEPRLDATIAAFNRMSTRLAELNAQAREVQARAHLTEIGEIARGIAHSLRNPLNALGLTINELAARGTEVERGDALAETCRQQIERIDRTLRSFLALSAGRNRVLESVDVVGVAQDVAMEAAQVSGGRVRIEFEPSTERPTVAGIAAEVRTALHVLVVNAVEASSPGDTVALRVESADGEVRIVVEDEGPGIPHSIRDRLFEPHVTTKEQGAGLGVFLAERIAGRRYRGGIRFEDRQPRGTRAVLTLRDARESAVG